MDLEKLVNIGEHSYFEHLLQLTPESQPTSEE